MKTLADGTKSLYLDIYSDGKRSYEFLRLYLLPGTSRQEKDANRETLALANAVKARRIVELNTSRFGFHRKESVNLLAYMEALGRKKAWNVWRGCLAHVKVYEKRRGMTLEQATPLWCSGFRDYLASESSLGVNTAARYWRVLLTMLNTAVKDGLIASNPARAVDGLSFIDSDRTYLTIDELHVLARNRDGRSRKFYDAFLFSCLTGLRRSDVAALTWDSVEDTEEGTLIRYRQKKTRGMEWTYISDEARQLMGERGGDSDKVFTLPISGSRALKNWMRRCGIHKDITFHSARHTFATMMLTIGTDIYTTSKLLGHRRVQTTQIYAKIVDEKKKMAVDNIPDIGIE